MLGAAMQIEMREAEDPKGHANLDHDICSTSMVQSGPGGQQHGVRHN